MKLLTISIAAYNVEKYLEKALTSMVCSPTAMEKLEVIIEDDGSTDGTISIAKKYEKLYPDVYRAIHKENGGYGSTINNSIVLAQGKYFKQLDGDDWFDTENIEQFLNWLSAVDADFVVTPYYNCFEGGKTELVDNCKALKSIEGNISLVNSCGNIAMHELTIKTELLRNNHISITERCFYTDNEYTFLPLMFAKTVIKFEKPLYCYRLGREGQSVSIEGVKKHYRDAFSVAEKLYKAYEDNKEITGEIDAIAQKKLCYITDTVYTYCLVVSPNREMKIKLKEFDEHLKRDYTDIYRMTNVIKKVKLLRLSGFLTYAYLREEVLKKWK